MSDNPPNNASEHLGWDNVGLGLVFVAANALISSLLGLGVGRSLLTAAIRCIIQLTIMAALLQKIFETENNWAVAGLAGL
jgi:ABC-type iron transport system FetAB permease component